MNGTIHNLHERSRMSREEAEEWSARFGPGAIEPDEIADQPDQQVLNVIDPTIWQNQPVPPRRWLVADLVPLRTVSTVTGDGAAGKSTLMLQLAVAGAAGKPWLGISMKPFHTLYVSAEDDADELHRRIDAIARHEDVPLADLGDLRLIDLVGEDAVLGALDRQTNQIRPTKLYQAINGLIEQCKPDLLILDSLADAFAGMENDRQQARQFVGLLKRLCRAHGITVILIAHPSVAGMASGTGSSGNTAWNNSVRSRLYFEIDAGGEGRNPDPDMRTLTTKKSNYGPVGGRIVVKYHQGAFIAQEGGTAVDAASRAANAERIFLELLTLYDKTGQNVSAKTSNAYAPARFAAHPDANGVSRIEFAAAMQRLLKVGNIKSEQLGPPSRQTSRLAIVEAT